MTRLAAWGLVLGVGLGLLNPSTMRGQDVVAGPGDVVTAPVPVPSDLVVSTDRSVSFAIHAPQAVAVVSPRAGTFEWEPGDPMLLPVTVRVPTTVRAGKLSGLSVTFAAPGGESRTVRVPISVRSAHQLAVDLVPAAESAERGGSLTLRYVVSNQGNAADSVRLTLLAAGAGAPSGLPRSIWLEPFETREGEFSIPIPSTAPVGRSEYVRLTAEGTDTQGADHATFLVQGEQGLFPSLVQVPTTIFLGSTVSATGIGTQAYPVLSVNGGGKVGHNTDLLFSYRLHPEGSVGYAFRGLFSRPGLLIAVRRPSWEAAVGDLNPRVSPLLGYSHQSRGFNGTWRTGRLSFNAIGGRPLAPSGGASDGHVGAVELGYDVTLGRASILVSSTERRSPGVAESAVDAALARFDGGVRDHTFGLDVGPMRVEDLRTGDAEQGLSMGGRYAYRSGRSTADLRALLVPKLAADPRLPASQVRGSGSLPLSRKATIRGSAFTEEAARTSFLEGSRVYGGEAGVGLQLAGWSLGLSAVGRDVTGRQAGSRQNLRIDGSTHAGNVRLHGTAALGRSSLEGASDFFQRYRVGASWRQDRTALNVSLTYSDDLLQPASVLVDASGSYRVSSRVELFGVVTSFHDHILDGVPIRTLTDDLTVRLGSVINLGGALNAYAGIERLPSGAGGLEGEWRLSAGIQQGMPLPLPVRRPPVVSGIIFEDVDGDGVRSADDVLLDGASLRMGFEQAVSRPGGRFEFRSADLASVTVETRALGEDYLPLADLPVPDDRYLEIAVVRSADVRVSAFLDSNGNGRWDAGELAADGLEIVIRREADEAWEISTGVDGRVTLGSVRPGTFVVSVVGESLPRRALLPESQSVTVRGGEAAEVRVPIPMRQINFSRFGAPGDECGVTSVCDDD